MSDVDQPIPQSAEADAAVEPEVRPEAQRIDSRFLFVDVAALRAKQLRRGAKSRLEPAQGEVAPVAAAAAPARKPKAERVAMQEVRSRLVEWDLPDFKAVFDIR
jgi:DNA-directed RNA polymerase subunit K/omega